MARTTANTPVQTPAVVPFDVMAYIEARRRDKGVSIAERVTNIVSGSLKSASYHGGKAWERLAGAGDVFTAGQAVGEVQAGADVKKYAERAAKEIEEALSR